jgi:hypothetical protein
MDNKKIIFLYGRHSNRTPFSYSPYRKLFGDSLYTSDYRLADYLVTGYCRDFFDNAEDVLRIVNDNTNIRLVALSEEPLWDTLWKDNDFQKQLGVIEVKSDFFDCKLEFYFLNHVTSNIYDFENFPYFITTDDEYFLRYSNMFRRNSKLTSDYFLKNWKVAQVRFAAYAARRVGSRFNVSFRDGAIFGLNAFRSLITERMDGDGILTVGQGWGATAERQVLPDWHLDKLVALDCRTFMVSALENTHISNYVSEKIFDAFAVQAIPIYLAQPGHDVFRIVEEGSFVNLVGLSVDQALDEIKNFSPDKYFVDRYRSTQARLAKIFSNPSRYISERKRVVSEIISAFSRI